MNQAHSHKSATSVEQTDAEQLIQRLHQFEQSPPPATTISKRPLWLGVVAVLLAAAGWAWHVSQAAAPVLVQVTMLGGQANQAQHGSGGPQVQLEASGYVVAPDSATVSSNLTGRVSAINVELGDRVKAGQPVATLDDRQARIELNINQMSLQSERIMLALQQRDLQLAKSVAERAERLKANQTISSEQYDQAISSLLARQLAVQQVEQTINLLQNKIALNQKMLEDLVIRAPFDGTVTALTANVGEIISPASAGGTYTRTGICTIADLQNIEYHFDVNERFLPQISLGQPVDVRLVSNPALQLRAKVRQIAPTTDAQTGTVVVIAVPETNGTPMQPAVSINPGSTASGTFFSPANATEADHQTGGAVKPATLLIPAAAVRQEPSGHYVFVVAQGQAKKLQLSHVQRQQEHYLLPDTFSSPLAVITWSAAPLTEGLPVQRKE